MSASESGSMTLRSPVRDGHADLDSSGVPYPANPDLPERLRTGAPIADLDASTLYTPGAAGYTDYPRLGAGAVAA